MLSGQTTSRKALVSQCCAARSGVPFGSGAGRGPSRASSAASFCAEVATPA